MKRCLLVLLGVIIFILPEVSFAGGCADVDNDENINILDIVYLINFIYKNGPDPDCGTEIGTLTDIDGNNYYTVKIGDDWWMAENLRVTHYRNGNSIPHVTDGSWEGLTEGAYCEYENDEDKVEAYGRLYNWYAVNDSRNIAPEGWHVPSDAEWQALINSFGGGGLAGGELKENGTTHWASPNYAATNESGFSAMPGGARLFPGLFIGLGTNGLYWSTTESYSGEAWIREMIYNGAGVNYYSMVKTSGFSVRCVKD